MAMMAMTTMTFYDIDKFNIIDIDFALRGSVEIDYQVVIQLEFYFYLIISFNDFRTLLNYFLYPILKRSLFLELLYLV